MTNRINANESITEIIVNQFNNRVIVNSKKKENHSFMLENNTL